MLALISSRAFAGSPPDPRVGSGFKKQTRVESGRIRRVSLLTGWGLATLPRTGPRKITRPAKISGNFHGFSRVRGSKCRGSGRVGSGHCVLKSHGSGRVGLRGLKISRVGSRDFKLSRVGSGWVRSGRVGSGRVRSRGFEVSRVGSGRVKRFGNLAGRVGS